MTDILFWGATGQAQVLHEAIAGSKIKLVALVDNRKIASPIAGLKVLHGFLDLDQWLKKRKKKSKLYFVVAIGGDRGKDRLELARGLEARGLTPLSIIHPRAFIAKNATLGPGCQILALAAVCAHTKLGHSVIINTSASIDHGCKVGDGVHIGPGAHIAGEVTIGRGAFIGTGAVVLPRIHIGNFATVGGGTVVIRDVPDGATVVGNPARRLSVRSQRTRCE